MHLGKKQSIGVWAAYILGDQDMRLRQRYAVEAVRMIEVINAQGVNLGKRLPHQARGRGLYPQPSIHAPWVIARASVV